MGIKMLVDPVYTLRDTTRCITHYALDECARHLLKSYPDSFVYYIRPDDTNVFDPVLAADFPGRVKFFDGKYWHTNRVFEFLWGLEWLRDIASGVGYAWDWDILITTRGPAMARIRWMNWAKALSPKKIIVHDHFPILKFKVGAAALFTGVPDLELTTLTSYLMADKVVPLIDYEVKDILKTARKYLSAAMCKKLRSKLEAAFVTPRGLDLDYPLKKKSRKKGETMVGIFTQRVGVSGRHPESIFDTFMYSFVKRDPGTVEFQLSTNSMTGIDKDLLKKCSFIKTYRSSREQFYDRLRESDFCLSFSTTESIPTSILEAICWGCIPILIRHEWSEDMCGKDYKFLFSKTEEAVGMINKIIDNPAAELKAFQEWYGSYFVKYVKEHDRLFGIIDEMVAQNQEEVADWAKGKGHNDTVQAIIKFVKRKGIKRATLLDILLRMYKAGEIRVNPKDMGIGYMPQQSMGHTILYRMPKYYGVMHNLLQHTEWTRGLEPGELIMEG